MTNAKIKILHITVHMGGGAGNAISSIICADNKNEHKVVVLQSPQKRIYIDRCVECGIEVWIEPEMSDVEDILEWADIVVISWWNHPLLNAFLVDFPNVPVRLILWCHVSGCTYPYLPYEFVDLFSFAGFTSWCSFDNKWWTKEQVTKLKKKSNVIYGMGPLSKYVSKKNYHAGDKVVVGYLGTLLKSKIHPMFVRICKDIISRNPNIYFHLYGDVIDGAWICDEAEREGISDHVLLLGYTNAVNETLLNFDIFGYPLNNYNYATTENSLLEAMATGLPIVAMNQGTEKYIIDNDVTGILACDIEKYKEEILKLSVDIKKRERLGNEAKKGVYQKFDFDENVLTLQNTIRIVLEDEKRMPNFKAVLGSEPADWFKTFLNPNDRQRFITNDFASLEHIFFEKSKSSVHQYASTFLDDTILQIMSMELLKVNG